MKKLQGVRTYVDALAQPHLPAVELEHGVPVGEDLGLDGLRAELVLLVRGERGRHDHLAVHVQREGQLGRGRGGAVRVEFLEKKVSALSKREKERSMARAG